MNSAEEKLICSGQILTLTLCFEGRGSDGYSGELDVPGRLTHLENSYVGPVENRSIAARLHEFILT